MLKSPCSSGKLACLFFPESRKKRTARKIQVVLFEHEFNGSLFIQQ